jgi:hypothetical protein
MRKRAKGFLGRGNFSEVPPLGSASLLRQLPMRGKQEMNSDGAENQND